MGLHPDVIPQLAKAPGCGVTAQPNHRYDAL